jgi:DNA polymerase-3 subunit epsilon
MTPGSQGDWTTAQLVALDLEGSGAQDRDSEAILEIAVVPITAGQPDMPAAYTTLVNSGRAIPRRPWISPGLTADALAGAPSPAEVGPELARRVDRRAVVGHNVSVDWRLLHRRYPAIAPTALIDTLRLARSLNLDSKNSLSALTDHLGLTGQVERLAAGSQPHRALWDTVATALLLPALVARRWPAGATLSALLETASIGPPVGPARPGATSVQDTLFGPALRANRDAPRSPRPSGEQTGSQGGPPGSHGALHSTGCSAAAQRASEGGIAWARRRSRQRPGRSRSAGTCRSTASDSARCA